ncbi:MAG: desulfoferrodoxin [Coriobacteriales bacterium]|nr:desulfoferrodoxin [Coriobacteriales bacterium]
MKFYKCSVCGKIIAMVKETGVPTICCGQSMEEIIANTVDASREKHVPVYEVVGNIVNVTIGSVEHPMTEEHHIQWIALETKHGNQSKVLHAGDAPNAPFALLDGDEILTVYAYCNIHGLWKA